MSSNPHRIQRQLIELELGRGIAGPQFQEALSAELRDSTMPALSATFDAVAGPDELLRLDRLEIDLGTIVDADWAPRFRERLIAQITRELARFTPEAEAARPGSGTKAPAELMRTFLFFLAEGRLPWWGARPAPDFGAEFARAGSMDWNALRTAVLGDARARERLIEALDDEQLEALVARWCGLPHAARMLSALAPAATATRTAQPWRRQFWRLLFDRILGDGFHAGRDSDLVGVLLAARLQIQSPFAPAVQPDAVVETQRVIERLVNEDVPSPWREWLAAVQETGFGAAAGHSWLATAPESLTDSKPLSRSGRTAPPPQGETEAGIYLLGAGAVLLHPFLEPLFRDRGLLAGREFRDNESRMKAVRLIGLLCFGVADVPEYDLVLAKQLCGHPLAETVVFSEFDATDIAACDALLAAVLHHWSALRSSSTEWLRTQFFLREGKLEEVESGFRLTVERRAQDVLLTRLPWGFGVIGLPWMEAVIFVRWLD
jgi:hypothetical protein